MKQKRTIVICQGIQGSGKSTWAKEWVKEDPNNRVRYNNDSIVEMLGANFSGNLGMTIRGIRQKAIEIIMRHGFNLVVDNMNLDPKHTRELGYIITKVNNDDDCPYEYEPVFKTFFETPLDECIRRDSLRPKPIGEEVIRNTYEKFKVVHGESIFHVNK